MDYSQYTQYYSDHPSASVATLASAVLTIAGMWKAFEKAGTAGWHAIIPFLNIYDMCRIGGSKRPGLLTLLCILLPIVYLVPCIKVAKAFGKGALFGVGMFFLSFLFLPILGFGSAEYLG